MYNYSVCIYEFRKTGVKDDRHINANEKRFAVLNANRSAGWPYVDLAIPLFYLKSLLFIPYNEKPIICQES